jgi:CRISPR/Cas system CMR-associated protein Cmr1 (group 7 of RAMP superfamily)
MSIRMYPKYYPVLRTPWNLNFRIYVLRNPKIKASDLWSWFHHGGMMLGLGAKTGRGFGRFRVTKFEPSERW